MSLGIFHYFENTSEIWNIKNFEIDHVFAGEYKVNIKDPRFRGSVTVAVWISWIIHEVSVMVHLVAQGDFDVFRKLYICGTGYKRRSRIKLKKKY